MKENAEKNKGLIDIIYEEMQKLGYGLAKRWIPIIGTLLLWPMMCGFLLELSKAIHVYRKGLINNIRQFKIMGDSVGLFMETAYGLSFIMLISYLDFLLGAFSDGIKWSKKFLIFVINFIIIFIALYFDSDKSGICYSSIVLFGSMFLTYFIVRGMLVLISWCKLKLTKKMNNLSFYLTYHKNIQGPLITAIAGVFGTVIAAILSK